MRPRRLPREDEATLVEHLEELRGRILVSVAAIAVATAVAFAFHNRILDWLARPLPPDHRHLAAFSVTEPFSVSLMVSLYAGLLFALPVILSQVWSFLAPALDPAAERRIFLLAAFGLVLGAAGLAFGYGILLPRAHSLAHQLRHDELPSPDPGEHVLLVHRHHPGRRRLRLRDAADRARARQPRRALVDGRCDGTGARATSSSPSRRSRCRGPIP